MTKDVIAVEPDVLLVEAARIMYQHRFNGLPVIDKHLRLMGLVTQQDLILKTHALHLPTLIDLLSGIDIHKKDLKFIKDDLKKVVELKVKDVMNMHPLVISGETSVSDVAEAFANHHAVNPIPVVDKNNALIGVVSRYDIVRFFAGPDTFHADIEPASEDLDDPKLSAFVRNFERRFVLVSKARARLWFLVGMLFAILGFVVAWAWILRIVVK